MKGIYLSIFGLSIVNLSQFSVDLNLFYEGKWLIIVKAIGFIFLVCGAILSYWQGLTKEITFSKADYDQNLEGYFIEYKKFKRHMPIVRVFEKNDKGFEEVEVGIHYRGEDIFIVSNQPFDGKILMK